MMPLMQVEFGIWDHFERRPGVAVRRIADGGLSRTIVAATRATDVERPSTRAVLAAIRDEAAQFVRG